MKKLKTADKIKQIVIHVSLLFFTIFLGMHSIAYVMKLAREEPLKMECTNLPEYVYVSNIEQVDKKEEAIKKVDREKESEKMRIQFEENKRRWLENNPPVEVLFDEDRIGDTDYIIQYLKDNPVVGSCALVWIKDVVCEDWGKLVFPTER